MLDPQRMDKNIVQNKDIIFPAADLAGERTTLTNNEIKYIIKVIRSFENRGILLKGTTEKISSQDRGLFNSFLGPLERVGLPLMKNILKLLAESVLMPLELITLTSATYTVIKKLLDQRLLHRYS